MYVVRENRAPAHAGAEYAIIRVTVNGKNA